MPTVKNLSPFSLMLPNHSHKPPDNSGLADCTTSSWCYKMKKERWIKSRGGGEVGALMGRSVGSSEMRVWKNREGINTISTNN